MNENIQMFLEKLNQNPEAAAKFSAIQNPDEAYQLASSLQDGFTKEEFLSAMKDLAAVEEDSELSDADLEKIAGGAITEEIFDVGASSAAALAAAI